ncbi:MAG: hypothetical protein ACRD3M_11845 [Thermoanaerobaculia bacterium]
MSARLDRPAQVAVLAGVSASFVAAATLVGSIRPALLLDGDPSWALARFLLTLLVVAASAASGGAAAALVLSAGRSPVVGRDLEPLELPAWALAVTAALALLLGACVRFAGLERLPFPLWHDEVLVLPQALALEGRPRDFRDAVRTISDDGGNPSGTVGVLYLEAFRAVLSAFGTTVFGVRFLSAFAGVLSLATAMLLGRALLPRGGGMLAGLALAGLRWHLILSRWAWVLIFVVPILDVATLLALRARRRVSAAAAAGAGVVAGIGTHVYLSAWVAAPSLILLLLWPAENRRRRLLPALCFAASFAAAALPLFLLREGRRASYLVRASNHNVAVEMRRTRSALPLVRAARTALLAPWWLPDPNPGNDLPGRRRLPLPLTAALALSLLRAGVRPREDLSALLLAHAAMAFLASLAWGERLSPNGSRFAYLTTVTAVAVAAGLLWLVGLLPGRLRRAGALLAVGGLLVSGAHAAGDLLLWDRERPMYVGLVGQHTSVGWAAARWERYGEVRLEPSPLYGLPTVETIRRHRILPRREAAAAPPRGSRERVFRICPPGTSPGAGERAVERVRDGWGKEWAVIYGRANGP